jgi:predicted Rossmann fold nucleotide-binding protein DprA/Smf involved in DNA uptake
MSRIVAWTGHRPELFRDPVAAHFAVEEIAADLVRRDAARRFLVGGQRGVDTWAALSAIALGVPSVVILPLGVAEFTAQWPAEDRSVLETTLAAAIEIHIIGTTAGYTERNRFLATHADLLVAVWAGITHGGTFETITFAREAGVVVREVLLDPSPEAGSAQGRGI